MNQIELKRILLPGTKTKTIRGVTYRVNPGGREIHGTLHTAADLEAMFNSEGLHFHPIPEQNGALLYFSARKSI